MSSGREDEDDSVTFEIRGQLFDCARSFDELPPDAIADFLLADVLPREAPAHRGVFDRLTDSLGRLVEPHGVTLAEFQALAHFTELAVHDKARWREATRSKENVIGVGDLIAVAAWLMDVYRENDAAA